MNEWTSPEGVGKGAAALATILASLDKVIKMLRGKPTGERNLKQLGEEIELIRQALLTSVEAHKAALVTMKAIADSVHLLGEGTVGNMRDISANERRIRSLESAPKKKKHKKKHKR
jgi:hypothetical protein